MSAARSYIHEVSRYEDCSADGEILHDIETGTKMANEETGIVLAIFRSIMPPDVNDPPEKQHSWKWRVTVILWCLLVLAPFSALVIYRFLMVDGYARQSDVTQLGTKVDGEITGLTTIVVGIRSDVHDQRVASMQSDLFSLSTDVIKDKGTDREMEDCRQFKKLERRYLDLNGSPYPSSVCSEF